MLEVLSPAGSSDALIAAVQNGADAVYLGYGTFNARMNAKNFTEEQLRQSVSYCHVRGVKVYLTLNTLVLDRELKDAGQVILEARRAGVDAILVQDLGILRLVRQMAPDMPIHASPDGGPRSGGGEKGGGAGHQPGGFSPGTEPGSDCRDLPGKSH